MAGIIAAIIIIAFGIFSVIYTNHVDRTEERTNTHMYYNNE